MLSDGNGHVIAWYPVGHLASYFAAASLNVEIALWKTSTFLSKFSAGLRRLNTYMVSPSEAT